MLSLIRFFTAFSIATFSVLCSKKSSSTPTINTDSKKAKMTKTDASRRTLLLFSSIKTHSFSIKIDFNTSHLKLHEIGKTIRFLLFCATIEIKRNQKWENLRSLIIPIFFSIFFM